jgi:hypothetical protein
MARQFSAEHRANLRAKALLRKHDAATKKKISKTMRARQALIRRLLQEHQAAA